jgi:hypothetical protein
LKKKKSNINTIKKNIEHKKFLNYQYSILKEKCSSPISGSEFWLLLCNIRESKMQSEQHFSRKQRALYHRKKGTLPSENLGDLGPLAPPPQILRPCTYWEH